jgi:hypothetical protein
MSMFLLPAQARSGQAEVSRKWYRRSAVPDGHRLHYTYYIQDVGDSFSCLYVTVRKEEEAFRVPWVRYSKEA